MALTIETENPSSLLAAIKKAIDDRIVVTWAYDNDGDFTHTPEQWNKKAWLRPATGNGELRFTVIVPKGKTLTKVISGVYHGRFIEMLVTHFEAKFSTVTAIIP